MTNENPSKKPILFACAGCSNAGRVAYDVAQEMNLAGIAEMSCLAGVAAGKRSFLRKLDNREVWVVDGCPINCAAGVFEHLERKVDLHIRLFDFGVRKSGAALDPDDSRDLLERVIASVEAKS